MIGAIIGDVVGSRFEFHNYLDKDFDFFAPRCRFTDDTVMTCAVAQALMDSREDHSDRLRLRGEIHRLDVLERSEALRQLRQRLRHADQPGGFRRPGH